MRRTIGTLTLAIALVGALQATAFAQPAAGSILLTNGTVQQVDTATGTIVLTSGRRIRARHILVEGELVDITAVQPEQAIYISGIDLGYETARQTTAPKK